MRLDANYRDVLVQYPQEANKIYAKLQASTSKSKGMAKADMCWIFERTIEIRGYTILDILSGVDMTKPQPQIPTNHFYLVGKAGRWRGTVKLNSVPKAWTDKMAQDEADTLAKEEARLSARRLDKALASIY